MVLYGVAPGRGHAGLPGRRRGWLDAASVARWRRPGRSASAMTALLQVRRLTKSYLGLTAVDDVSFEVEAGAIVGLIGPNGSGKSTSIDCICGFQPRDGGRWSLAGRRSHRPAAPRIARAGLTRTFQTVRVYDELTLLDNLCVAAQEIRRHRLAARVLPHQAASRRRGGRRSPRARPAGDRRPRRLRDAPAASCPTASASCWPSPPR